GFVGGAAGELGADVGPLLLEWRLYTTGIGIVLGLVLAAVHYGRDAVIGLFRTEATAPDELVEGDVEAEELAGLDDRGSGPTR
ncbi:MAG TPA: hypothetical protein VFS05_16220, partial [Gemmatimonadaceae bacterium]|nr:hypothetical protein [Gemmatimonadaceae bacterium]